MPIGNSTFIQTPGITQSQVAQSEQADDAVTEAIQRAQSLRNHAAQAQLMAQRATATADRAGAMATSLRDQAQAIRAQLQTTDLSPEQRQSLEQQLAQVQTRADAYGQSADKALDLASKIDQQATLAEQEATGAEAKANQIAEQQGQPAPFKLRALSTNDGFGNLAQQMQQKSLLGSGNAFQNAQGAAKALAQETSPSDVAGQLAELLQSSPDSSFKELLLKFAGPQLQQLSEDLQNAPADERQATLMELAYAQGEAGPESAPQFQAAFEAGAKADAELLSHFEQPADLAGQLNELMANIDSPAYRQALAQQMAPAMESFAQMLSGADLGQLEGALHSLAEAFDQLGAEGAQSMAGELASSLDPETLGSLTEMTRSGTLGGALPERLAMALRQVNPQAASDIAESIATAVTTARARYDAAGAKVGKLNGKLAKLVGAFGSKLSASDLHSAVTAFHQKNLGAYAELGDASQQLGRLLNGAGGAVHGSGADAEAVSQALSDVGSWHQSFGGRDLLSGAAQRQQDGQLSFLDALPGVARILGIQTSSSFLRGAGDALAQAIAPAFQDLMDDRKQPVAASFLKQLLHKNPLLFGLSNHTLPLAKEALETALRVGGGDRLRFALRSLEQTLRRPQGPVSAFMSLARVVASFEKAPVAQLPVIDVPMSELDASEVALFTPSGRMAA